MANCPECDFEIDIDEFDVEKGDTLECDNCGVTLEVVSLKPLELEAETDDDDETDEKDDEDEDEDEDDDNSDQ